MIVSRCFYLLLAFCVQVLTMDQIYDEVEKCFHFKPGDCNLVETNSSESYSDASENEIIQAKQSGSDLVETQTSESDSESDSKSDSEIIQAKPGGF